MKREKGKIWIDENRIMNVEMPKDMKEDEIIRLLKEGRRIIDESPGQLSLLIDLTNSQVILSSEMRKVIAENAKAFRRDFKFKKVAFFGGLVQRTMASFVMAAVKARHTKVFVNREEALKWLKEP